MESLKLTQKYLGRVDGAAVAPEKVDLMRMVDSLMAEVCACCLLLSFSFLMV
jgi:hypothetical protein